MTRPPPTATTLRALFTVSIHLDENSVIRSTCPLIERHAPEIQPGLLLYEAFEVVRPRLINRGADFEFRLDMIHLLISRQSRYPIRAQMVHDDGEDGGFLLLGAPWLSRLDADQLHAYQLTDFPVHDAQLDWLFMLSAEKQQVRDLRELSDDLIAAKSKGEAARESKARFFAVMSHEMRTPLNAVIGTLGLLRDAALPEQQRDLVSLANNAAEQLLHIINDVLDFSKLEAGKLELEPATFHVRQVLDDVMLINQPHAAAKGIQLHGDVAEGVPNWLHGDDGKIKQVLLNLISNAIKFTDAGTVAISVSRPQHDPEIRTIRFEVADTGRGIAPEHRPKLFTEFWTTSSMGQASVSGTGLGLDICKRLTEALSGTIDFTSLEGAGSTFWIDIPLDGVDGHVDRGEEPGLDDHDVATRFVGRRVLLAEDNQANQIVGKLMLERLGMRVDVAGNGIEAIEAVRKRDYDLVLMDIGMPELDGLGATKAIRDDLGRSHLPIIACTAHSLAGHRQQTLGSGCSDYLAKPIERRALIAVLSRWLPEGANGLENVSEKSQTDALSVAHVKRMIADVGADNARRVLALMRDELGQRRTALLQAARARDFDGLARQAHALKSTTLSLGAHVLSETLERIECDAAECCPDAIKGATQASTELQRAQDAIDELNIEDLDVQPR